MPTDSFSGTGSAYPSFTDLPDDPNNPRNYDQQGNWIGHQRAPTNGQPMNAAQSAYAMSGNRSMAQEAGINDPNAYYTDPNNFTYSDIHGSAYQNQAFLDQKAAEAQARQFNGAGQQGMSRAMGLLERQATGAAPSAAAIQQGGALDAATAAQMAAHGRGAGRIGMSLAGQQQGAGTQLGAVGQYGAQRAQEYGRGLEGYIGGANTQAGLQLQGLKLNQQKEMEYRQQAEAMAQLQAQAGIRYAEQRAGIGSKNYDYALQEGQRAQQQQAQRDAMYLGAGVGGAQAGMQIGQWADKNQGED